MAVWCNEKASAIARIAFTVFENAHLTRNKQRQVLAIMGSALSVDSPLRRFLLQVREAVHAVVAPDQEARIGSDPNRRCKRIAV
jgi:hypothetical protein